MITAFAIDKKSLSDIFKPGEIFYSEDKNRLYFGGIDGKLMEVKCSNATMFGLVGLLVRGYTSITTNRKSNLGSKQYEIMCCFDKNEVYIDGEKIATLTPYIENSEEEESNSYIFPSLSPVDIRYEIIPLTYDNSNTFKKLHGYEFLYVGISNDEHGYLEYAALIIDCTARELDVNKFIMNGINLEYLDKTINMRIICSSIINAIAFDIISNRK